MDNRPIGIFDSGLGGLTVVKELERIMPNENIVYFGDTGRVPYGSKSNETILKYTEQIFEFLKEKDVKAIVAACGTASSVLMKNNITPGTVFTGVVVPSCLAALEQSKNKRIGVIGTSATVKSDSYASFISKIDAEAKVFSYACPLFVPLVENGMFSEDNEITKKVVELYLNYFDDKDIDTIILGCTHYPLLKDAISAYLGGGVKIIDSGEQTAQLIKAMLEDEDLLGDGNGKCEFYVSDSVENFCDNAKLFLGREISGVTHKKVLG
jgi:glutamate racemase